MSVQGQKSGQCFGEIGIKVHGMFVVVNAHIRWCNAAIENSDLASNPQRDIQLSVIQSMVQSDNAEAVEKWLTVYTNGE